MSPRAILLFGVTGCFVFGMVSCVPRERPEGDEHKEPKKVARTAPVAARQEVPEAPARAQRADDAGPTSAAKPQRKPAAKIARPAREQTAPETKRSGAEDELLKEPFSDDFPGPKLGNHWLATSNDWAIQEGRLCVQGAHNHPLWLKRRLPTNARIEFTATSYSNDGDIKVELWGNGRSAATGSAYRDASSYLAIFGGWQNRFHVLARLDEHASNRPEIKLSSSSGDFREQPVENGTTYEFKIERTDGKTVRWLVDDIELFSFSDGAPLKGPGHDHFGFNNWEVRVCFDKLRVTPLAD